MSTGWAFVFRAMLCRRNAEGGKPPKRASRLASNATMSALSHASARKLVGEEKGRESQGTGAAYRGFCGPSFCGHPAFRSNSQHHDADDQHAAVRGVRRQRGRLEATVAAIAGAAAAAHGRQGCWRRWPGRRWLPHRSPGHRSGLRPRYSEADCDEPAAGRSPRPAGHRSPRAVRVLLRAEEVLLVCIFR